MVLYNCEKYGFYQNEIESAFVYHKQRVKDTIRTPRRAEALSKELDEVKGDA